MKSFVFFLYLLLCSQAVYAADHVKKTEKGLFSINLSMVGKTLENGVNAFDLVVRDKKGKSVDEAELAVTPWLPAMGQGVWDKPVVTVRGRGKYHVSNIVTTINGRWELKIAVNKGSLKDRAVFFFEVANAGPAPRENAYVPRGNY